MRRFHHSQGIREIQSEVYKRVPRFASKFAWFLDKGYSPHLFQAAFHTLCDDFGRLLRHRFLVAGRRGGKTLSAAWEVACYCINPSFFHWDAHGIESEEPLHVWILVPDFRTTGRAAMRTFRKVLTEAGMSQGNGYKWNRGEHYVEFENGTFVEFKTAESAENLVGAGIDILWIDEAALIPNETAYEYASPALDDRMGVVIGTTTPRGKNWYYDLGWGPSAQEDETKGTVEYTSIHNPHFKREAWEYRRRTYHPMKFKQEYMAAFDSWAGKELSGEWLSYYQWDEIPLRDPEKGYQRTDGSIRIENLKLHIYLGVDPAVSLNDRADRFAVAVLGVSEDFTQAYILDTFLDRLAFPEQVDLIQKYHLRWRPQLIGVEDQAYQKSLVQQASRLSTMPPILGQPAKGKKADRILSMAPSFRIGQVKIREEHRDFIDEWLNYDSATKNPKDDLLDATEIAIRTAGILLPGFSENNVTKPEEPPTTVQDFAALDLPSMDPTRGYDENMGAEW